MMGISNQDLVFKLKSIGVRVEGDDAFIDTDIISAILQGKKMPHPREVILRDEQTAQEGAAATARRRPQPAAPVRRAPANPLRPMRPRTMIQKVEPGIRSLPVSDRAAAPSAAASVAGAASDLSETVEMLQPDVLETLSADPTPLVTEAPAAPVRPVVTAPPVSQPPLRPSAPPSRPGSPYPGSRPYSPSGPPRSGAPSSNRPGGPPGRPGGPPSRPGGPPSRPGGPPGRPSAPSAGAGAPTGSNDALRRRLERAQEEQRAALEKKKKAKGAKKPGPHLVDDQDLKAYTGSVEDIDQVEDDAAEVSGRRRRRAARKEEEEKDGGKLLTFKKDRPTGTVTISEGMTLREFAEKLGVKARDLLKALFDRGIIANINQVVETELAQQLAKDLGVDTMVVSFEEEEQLRAETGGTAKGKEVTPEGKVPRGPVVTIMGHVDHGKTSLLDAIRSSKLAEAESGGITQHIGAYQVDVHGKPIVFLDTPGHEAFTMMRARGAKVTDIVVLVVAADDGVMPQTIEAIDHARAAKVPMVVAINKIDKANANMDRVKKELSDRGLVPEDWGGDTVMVPVSALRKEGIQTLLEMIQLTADILDLRASPEIQAQGAVIEARKEVGRGIVATVLVQNGTLHVGDIFVSGATWGRVRSMSNDLGARQQEALPATPVEVTGFNEIPDAGDQLQVVEDESRARGIAEFRAQEMRRRDLSSLPHGRLSLEQLFSRIQEGEVKELPVVLKADVQGSVEVLRDALSKISTDKVRLQVIHAGVGAISTNDVLLASASKAVIVGFNVRPERSAADLAEKEQVDIRLHTVIYEIMDELRLAMTGLLDPTYREVSAGRAEVRDTFKVPKIGTIAGCHVIEGVIPRTAAVRLVRDGRVVYEGKISSLRRFKDDASEVRSGFDCGIGLDRFQDLKPGDIIEAHTREEVAPVL
jgi:translation initiation factor IF-2